MSRGLGIGWPHLPERGGVTTCSNTQVPRPPPRGASLPGHLAFVCDAWHMLGSYKRIKHRSRERLQKVELESPQAVAQYLGRWLKMQELGLHLRAGELVPGERPGSPCSNQPPRVSAQQLSEVVVGAHRRGGWKQGVGPGVLGCLMVIDV